MAIRARLFRTHVGRGPDHQPDVRIHRAIGKSLAESFCDAEIDDFRSRMSVNFGHQYVRWLDVPVDDALLMRVMNRLTHIHK